MNNILQPGFSPVTTASFSLGKSLTTHQVQITTVKSNFYPVRFFRNSSEYSNKTET